MLKEDVSAPPYSMSGVFEIFFDRPREKKRDALFPSY